MELFQELLLTAFFAVVLSCSVAKLVAIATAKGDDTKLSGNDKINEVTEDVKFQGGLRTLSAGNESRVQSVEGGIEKVVEFSSERTVDESLVLSDCVSEVEVEDVPEIVKSPEEDLSEVREGTSNGKSVEKADLEKILIEERMRGRRLDEFDDVEEENEVIVSLSGDKIVEQAGVDDEIVENAGANDDNFENGGADDEIVECSRVHGEVMVNFGNNDDVVAQAVEIRDLETGDNNQGIGMGGVVEGDDVKRGLIDDENVENVTVDDEIMLNMWSGDDVVAQAVEIGHGEREENAEGGIENHGVEGLFDDKNGEKACIDDDAIMNLGSINDISQAVGIRDEESGTKDAVTEDDEKRKDPIDNDMDEDDDWEGIEKTELDEAFAAAANYVNRAGKDDQKLNLDPDIQMQLYGLNKVATEGPCHEPQPMALKVSARAKWNAWQRLGNMSPEVAMEQYITLLSDNVPEWMEATSCGGRTKDSSGVSDKGTYPPNQLNPMKERMLEVKSITDEGDLTGGPNSVNKI